jgi:hypothetical protein
MQKILHDIRRKNRQQWSDQYRDILLKLRIWVQENGESALLVGFVLGVLLALAPRFFFGLLLVTGVVLLIVWFIALPAESLSTPFADSSGPDSSPTNDRTDV